MSDTDPCNDNFNWFSYLKQDPKSISGEDAIIAGRLAAEWVTCACGQLCKVLPRTSCGSPQDKQLSDLGVNFCEFICRMRDDILEMDFIAAEKNRNKAEEILKNIEFMGRILNYFVWFNLIYMFLPVSAATTNWVFGFPMRGNCSKVGHQH